MFRRHRTRVVPAAALVAVGVAVWWGTRPRVCEATMRQVRGGMTRDQIVATLGGPPGVYGEFSEGAIERAAADVEQLRRLRADRGLPSDGDVWVCRDGVLYVRFVNDRADDVRRIPYYRPRSEGWFVRWRQKWGF